VADLVVGQKLLDTIEKQQALFVVEYLLGQSPGLEVVLAGLVRNLGIRKMQSGQQGFLKSVGQVRIFKNLGHFPVQPFAQAGY